MLTVLTATFLAMFSSSLPVVEPKDDLVITESCIVKPGEYRIPDAGKPGVLRIEGEHLTVILDGVTLIGSKEGAKPDEATGTGVVVTGTGNIVHGGTVRGYKVGMFVDGGEGHWVIETKLTHGFAQHLKSTPEAEDPSDWLWPHENDDGQWAKNYGAGILVRGAKDVHLLKLSGRAQQNGILLERVTGSIVRGCDFSFLSGWGLAMWRSSDNHIERNSFDWCVRGFSNKIYERGQDSAGILVFEQCNRNVILGNSATHSGDGLFLYAGNETVKQTGEGGSNDNVVDSNDFSFAVANGIEATFSTGNRFVNNLLEGCNYGVWAGYSRKTVIEKNTLKSCLTAGVAIEHGSDNEIRGNRFEDCRIAVDLWWDPDPDLLSSVYGKKNPTDSADTAITGNVITGGEVALSVRDSKRISFTGNSVDGTKEAVAKQGECPDLVVKPAAAKPKLDLLDWKQNPLRRRGRRFILPGEWWPYDFSEPRLSPKEAHGGQKAVFAVLGLQAAVDLVGSTGNVHVDLRYPMESDPEVVVTPNPGATGFLPYTFELATGDRKLKGSGELLVTTFQVSFWNWTEDPREDPAAFAALLKSPPAKTVEVPSIDFPWRQEGPGAPVGNDRFATLATATVTLPAGTFEITTNSDDGVRVFVDGKVVIDNWTKHGPTVDRAQVTVTAGDHVIRVEHFEIDGYAWLTFGLRPAS